MPERIDGKVGDKGLQKGTVGKDADRNGREIRPDGYVRCHIFQIRHHVAHCLHHILCGYR